MPHWIIILLGILLTFLVFFVVVMIHEFGHFFTARMVGMRVLEFGFGIPPRIKKIFTDKKGTDFTLNALPFGGFVRIDGEDFSKPSAFEDGAFMSKKLPSRILVLAAGVIMNFFLAFLIFFGMFLAGTKPLTVIPNVNSPTHSFFLPSLSEAINSGYISTEGTIRLDPLPDSLAYQSGIRAGDIAVAIDTEKITTIDDFIKKIQNLSSFSLEVLRDGQPIFINIVPKDHKIGTQISYNGLVVNPDFSQKSDILGSAILASKETYATSVLTFTLIKNVFSNLLFPPNPEAQKQAQDNLSWPIGAGRAFVTMIENSVPVTTILLFVALLSINLWVMNILPFPALDGGRIVFTTIYSIWKALGFRKEKILHLEAIINFIGFSLLLLFMLYISWLDIWRFF